MQITITVYHQAVQAALARMAQQAGHTQPLMARIAERLYARTDARFSAQAGPDGQPWAPLKPATRKHKRGPLTLQESGRLRAGIIWGANATAAWLGSNQPYAAIHQWGGTISKGAQSRLVRHRTDAKGQLLRSAIMGGAGLVFAKDSHKRAQARWFAQGAHQVRIPARPYLPARADGSLYPADQAAVVAEVNAWLATAGGSLIRP
ncbi:MAG: phage virion morphogenesis protein [Proteobacteria bacterium]|nr:phage virion morphogenesis protein [Pseudomonadota bacterium]